MKSFVGALPSEQEARVRRHGSEESSSCVGTGPGVTLHTLEVPPVVPRDPAWVQVAPLEQVADERKLIKDDDG